MHIIIIYYCMLFCNSDYRTAVLVCVHAVLISSSLTWDVFAFTAEKRGGGGGEGVVAMALACWTSTLKISSLESPQRFVPLCWKTFVTHTSIHTSGYLYFIAGHNPSINYYIPSRERSSYLHVLLVASSCWPGHVPNYLSLGWNTWNTISPLVVIFYTILCLKTLRQCWLPGLLQKEVKSAFFFFGVPYGNHVNQLPFC